MPRKKVEPEDYDLDSDLADTIGHLLDSAITAMRDMGEDEVEIPRRTVSESIELCKAINLYKRAYTTQTGEPEYNNLIISSVKGIEPLVRIRMAKPVSELGDLKFRFSGGREMPLGD